MDGEKLTASGSKPVAENPIKSNSVRHSHFYKVSFEKYNYER